MHTHAQSAYDIYTFKPFPSFDIFDLLPARSTAVFTLKKRVYTAFININTLSLRYPFYFG